MTIRIAGFRTFTALGLLAALGLLTALPPAAAAAAEAEIPPPPQSDVSDMARDLTVVQQNIHGAGATAAATGANALKVQTWVDRADGTYAVGESVRLFVRTNKDAYVTVLNVGASGRTTVLFPNQYQPNNKVAANRSIEIAPPNSVARISVGGPVGAELIKVVASTSPKPVVPPQQTAAAGAFRLFDGAPDDLARDLTVTVNQAPAHSVATINKIIRTVAPPQGASVTPGLLPAPTPGVLPGMPAQQPYGGQPYAGQTYASQTYGGQPYGGQPPAPTYAGQPQPAIPQPVPQPYGQGIPQPAPLGTPSYPAAPNAMPVLPGAPMQGGAAPGGVVYVSTDKQIYRMGEPVTVRVTAQQSCYLTLVNIPVRGTARVLFPNQAMQNNLVQANQPIVLPGAATGLAAIQASAPGGVENLVAVCSPQPQPVVGTSYDFSQLYPMVGTADAVSRDLVLASGRPGGNTALGVSGFIVVP